MLFLFKIKIMQNFRRLCHSLAVAAAKELESGSDMKSFV